MSSLSVPVLTYHGVNILENTYAENDHLALTRDLKTIRSLGRPIVPLASVVAWQLGELDGEHVRNAVALTFDDGSWFDYYDLEHPSCGPQRSLFNILRDHRKDSGLEQLHASSFVIASPEARELLDQRGLIGKGWWTDSWWAEAQRSGLMSIESHSWDHVHPQLDQVAQEQNAKGDFAAVASRADCDRQIAESAAYIRRVAGMGSARFFAYPYGQVSDYLAKIYFPKYGANLGYEAAFTTDARPVRRDDDRWRLPRFVFGRDWNAPSGLEFLLADAA
jgi:peptidoglycan/xylan/chitin deacetylase (PgdA/CDA1 family)